MTESTFFMIGLFHISIAKWRAICSRHQTITYAYFHKPALSEIRFMPTNRCITSTLVYRFFLKISLDIFYIFNIFAQTIH